MTTAKTTTRYVRERGQWVKITRDGEGKTWHFARGWDDSVKAHESQVWSLKRFTWADAIAFAQRQCADH